MTFILAPLEVKFQSPSHKIKVVENDSWLLTPVVFPAALARLAPDSPRRKLWELLFRARVHSIAMGETDAGEEPNIEYCAACLVCATGLHCATGLLFTLKRWADLGLLTFGFTDSLDSFQIQFDSDAVAPPWLN